MLEFPEEELNCFLGSEVSGFDGKASQTGVQGMTCREAGLGGVGVGEDWAGSALEHAPVKENGEGRVEEDGEGAGGLLKEEAVGEALWYATAECDDSGTLGKRGGEGRGFQAAEVGFSVLGEYLGDSEARALFEVGVEVEEVPAKAGSEKASNGGFAGAHEAGEGDALNSGGCGSEGLRLSFSLCSGLDIHRSLQLYTPNAKNATF